MKKKLDPNEAPKGYRACEYGADTNGCDRCAFRIGTDECHSAPCMPGLRRDGHEVYFVPAKPKRPSRTEAAVKSVLRRLQSKASYWMPKPSLMPVEIWLSDSDVRAIRRTLGIKSLRQYLKSKETAKENKP